MWARLASRPSRTTFPTTATCWCSSARTWPSPRRARSASTSALASPATRVPAVPSWPPTAPVARTVRARTRPWTCSRLGSAVRAVAKNLGKIKASETPLAALTREAYEAAKEKLLSIVNHDFGSGYLVLIGGIQINLPAPFEDMFQPLFFRASSSAGAEIDLLDELLVQ
mmetsp:Transcript_142001/g.441530  ORF Transcript_142001/g.441530 Transcript_142001/m.441530 type:complete len:169 (-) Transcript_142001:335-841(-)